MKTNLQVCVLTLVAVLLPPLAAQVSETLPSVPRADGTGPSIPSMANPGDARGSAATKATEPQTPLDRALNPDRPPAPVRLPTPRVIRGETAGDQPTTSVAGEPDVNTSLDTTAMAQQIRVATINDRPILLDALQERIEMSEDELDQVKQTAFTLQGTERRAYRAAMKDLRRARRQLDDRMSAAKSARAEEWPTLKEELSASYQAYWVAMTRVSAFVTRTMP